MQRILQQVVQVADSDATILSSEKPDRQRSVSTRHPLNVTE
jgi:hypothetical protein